MTNIVGLNGQAVEAPERTYDYEFTTKEGKSFVRHGVLTMNPMFYGVTTEDQRLIFSISADQVLTVDRLEPKPSLNS